MQTQSEQPPCLRAYLQQSGGKALSGPEVIAVGQVAAEVPTHSAHIGRRFDCVGHALCRGTVTLDPGMRAPAIEGCPLP